MILLSLATEKYGNQKYICLFGENYKNPLEDMEKDLNYWRAILIDEQEDVKLPVLIYRVKRFQSKSQKDFLQWNLESCFGIYLEC